MRKLSTFVDCLLITAVAVAAPTANEDFVVAEDAKTYTNAVNAANTYTDGKIAEIPAPDYSTNNAALVTTIQTTAPVPDNYANPTMPGRLRMSLPEDSEFVEPVAVFDYYAFIFDDMPGNPRVAFHNGGFRIDSDYGSAVGERDDFEGTVNFYLPNTPFERYEFRYTMSPVATLEKIEMTSRELGEAISTLRDSIPSTTSNIVTAAYINDRVNVTPLAGRTYNFATNIGLYTAVRDIIQALGGSVTNFPAIPQN